MAAPKAQRRFFGRFGKSFPLLRFLRVLAEKIF
jgi:hypothetical protein